MTTEFLNGLNQQERTQKHDQVGSTTPSGGCDSLISSKTAKKSHLLEEPQIIDPSNRYLEVSQSSDQAQTPDNQEEQTANELITRTVEATSTVDCRQIRGPNCDTRTTSKTRTIDDRRANTTITTRDRSGRVQRSIDSRSILNNKEKLKRFWEKRMEMEFKTRAEQQEQARRLSLAADEEQSDQNNNATDEMGFRLKGQKLRGAPASIRSAAASENEPNFDENNNDNDNENYNQTDDYAELVSAEVLCEKLLAVKRRRQGCVLDDDNASGQGDLNGRKLDRQHGAKPVSAANRESSVAADQQPMSINPVLCHLDEEEQPEQPPRQLQCLKIGTGGESLLTLAGCDEREEQSANEEFSSSNSSFGPMSISLTKTNGHDEDQQQAISSPLDSKPATGSSDDDEQGNDEEEEEEETSTQSGSVLTVISSNNNNSNNNNNNNLASDQTTTNQQREPKTGDQHTIDGVATATTSLITSIEDHQNTFNDAYNDGQGEGEQQSVREQEENDEDDGQQSNVEEQESDGSNIGVAFESLQFDDEIKSSKNELVDEARLLANDHYGSNNNNNGKGLQKVQAARRSTTTNPDKSSSSSSLSSAALLRASAATSESRAESTNNNNNNNNYNSSSSNSNRPMSKFNSREVKSVCSIITNAISDATKQVDDYIKSRARLGCADEGEHCAGKRRLANDDDEHDDDDDQEEAVAGAGRQPKVGSQFRAIVASDHSRRHEGDAAGDADCEDEDEEEAGGDVDNSAMMNRQRRRLRPIEGFQRATFVHESMAQVDAKPIGTTAASSAGPLQSGAPKLVSSRHDEDDDNENKFNHSGMEGTNDDDDDDERLSARPTPRHQPNSTILFNGCASSAEGEEADADDDDNDEEDDDDEAICNGFDEVPRADLSSIFEANVRREIERFESNSATAQLKRQLDSQGPGGQQQLSGGGGCGGSGAKSIAGQHQQTLSRSGLTEWRIAEEIRLFNERENELKQRSGGSSAQGAVGPAIAQRTTPNEKQQQQLEPVVRNGKTLHIPKHSVDKQPPAAGAVQMSRCIKLTTSSTNNAEQQQPTMISMHKFISSGGKRYVYQPISTMSNNSLANNTSHHHLTKSMSNLSSLSSSSSSSRTVDYRAVDSLRCKEVPNVKPGMTKKTIETFSRLTNAESGGGSLNRLDLSATQTTLAPSQEPGVQDHSQTRNSCGKARARYQNQAQKANGIPSAEWKIQEELREMKAREAELRSLRNNQLRQQKQPQEGPGETGLILEENETKESGYSNSRHRFMPTSDGLNRHQQPRKRTQSANFITTNDDHEPLEEEQQLQEGVMSVTGTVEDADEVHLLVNSQCVITTMNGHQHQSPPHNQNGAASNGKLFAASNGHSDWNKQQHGREQRSTGHDGDMEIERTDSDASSSPISSHSLYPIKQTIDSFRKLNASTESDNNNNSNNKRPARQVLMTQQMERGGGKKQTPPGKQQQQKRFVNSSASSVARSPAGSANITAAIAANNSLIARRPI